MSEILFRGKRVDNGEWVEGCGIIATEQWASIFVVIDDLETNSADIEEYEIISETVGEYTGLTDKNGKKIFEGDIIRYPAFDLNCHDFEVNGLSELNESGDYFYEVIGNIHDNPKLLKGGAEE